MHRRSSLLQTERRRTDQRPVCQPFCKNPATNTVTRAIEGAIEARRTTRQPSSEEVARVAVIDYVGDLDIGPARIRRKMEERPNRMHGLAGRHDQLVDVLSHDAVLPRSPPVIPRGAHRSCAAQ
jgi:hypothetical protein